MSLSLQERLLGLFSETKLRDQMIARITDSHAATGLVDAAGIDALLKRFWKDPQTHDFVLGVIEKDGPSDPFTMLNHIHTWLKTTDTAISDDRNVRGLRDDDYIRAPYQFEKNLMRSWKTLLDQSFPGPEHSLARRDYLGYYAQIFSSSITGDFRMLVEAERGDAAEKAARFKKDTLAP